MPDTDDDHLRLNEAQLAEYGTYVANKPIDIRGGRAFNPGDPVPVSHVTRGVVGKADVDKRSDDEAAAATSKTTGKG